MCNLVLLIELAWSHCKILIFVQVMGQNVLKNTNYSIYGLTFFGHNSAISWPIGLTFLMETQETIIYRLLDWCWEIVILMLFRPRWRQRVWGLKTQPKSWPTWWNFWVNHYLKTMSSKFRAWTPLELRAQKRIPLWKNL